jgi:hypothetical protein
MNTKTHTATKASATAEDRTVCPNCGQWQNSRVLGGFDCVNECVGRGFAPRPKAEARAKQNTRFHTESATLQGALCGKIWIPAVKCTLPITENMRQRFARFSVKAGATFRDALLSTLNEEGGDFQNASFTADTMLVIKRARNVTPGRYETRIREIEVSALSDCADLVDQETYSYDNEE